MKSERYAEALHIPAKMRADLSRLMRERVDPIAKEWLRRGAIFGLFGNPGDTRDNAPSLRVLLESVYLQGAADMAKALESRTTEPQSR